MSRPEAKPRRATGTLLATWLIRIEKLPAPAPSAIITPMVSTSPGVETRKGVSAQPAASSSVPDHITGQAPKRSASAPDSGCDTPHISWLVAIAKLMPAIVTVVSRSIGCTSSPSDIRRPIVTISTAAAPSTSRMIRRSLAACVLIVVLSPVLC